jgi:catechol 2,3-dioxygenase-like lactoylglutathione lyase family enzyme
MTAKSKLLRMDNVLIVVDDLEAAKAFFAELGMELEGETTVEGRWVDRVVGLNDVRADIEEEMLSAAAVVGKLQGLYQLHAQNVRVKIHGALHVTARQGEVVHASELELGIGERCHIFIPSRVGPQPRLHVLKAMITSIV